MDGFFTDWAEDDTDGFFNEDDQQVNKNDPFGQNREFFSPYEDNSLHFDEYDPEEDGYDPEEMEYDPNEIEILEDELTDLEDQLGAFEEDTDGSNVAGIMPAAGIIGGMISEEIADNVNNAQNKQRVSLKQFKNEAGPTSKKKLHLRPFEKWVNEILEGKRSVRDLSRLDRE